ncbi:MAG: hypothetical protein RIS79_1835 [Verrucomicrobiota bacterium]|jgi:glycosyltransferase involved in cell wall biosynthesis
MSAPFFSIGIPTFNRKEYLRQTLDAVLAQSFADFEVLIHDNASSDGTQEMLASNYSDPRIRYHRHPKNLGAAANIAGLANTADGEFIIINQDDDLLHRDFLLRCHEAVAGKPEVAMYGCPVWREQHGRGYSSRLLRTNEGYVHEFMLQDCPIYMDGGRMAVSLLNLSYYFLHPTIALRRQALQKAGGYVLRDDALIDIITEARVLLQGNFAYDPRPGAMFRDHPNNEWKRYDRTGKKRMMGKTLQCVLKDIQQSVPGWNAHLEAELRGYSRQDMELALREWTTCAAPDIIIQKGLQELRSRNKGHAWKFATRMLRKLGVRNYLKYGLH